MLKLPKRAGVQAWVTLALVWVRSDMIHHVLGLALPHRHQATQDDDSQVWSTCTGMRRRNLRPAAATGLGRPSGLQILCASSL